METYPYMNKLYFHRKDDEFLVCCGVCVCVCVYICIYCLAGIEVLALQVLHLVAV